MISPWKMIRKIHLSTAIASVLILGPIGVQAQHTPEAYTASRDIDIETQASSRLRSLATRHGVEESLTWLAEIYLPRVLDSIPMASDYLNRRVTDAEDARSLLGRIDDTLHPSYIFLPWDYLDFGRALVKSLPRARDLYDWLRPSIETLFTNLDGPSRAAYLVAAKHAVRYVENVDLRVERSRLARSERSFTLFDDQGRRKPLRRMEAFLFRRLDSDRINRTQLARFLSRIRDDFAAWDATVDPQPHDPTSIFVEFHSLDHFTARYLNDRRMEGAGLVYSRSIVSDNIECQIEIAAETPHLRTLQPDLKRTYSGMLQTHTQRDDGKVALELLSKVELPESYWEDFSRISCIRLNSNSAPTMDQLVRTVSGVATISLLTFDDLLARMVDRLPGDEIEAPLVPRLEPGQSARREWLDSLDRRTGLHWELIDTYPRMEFFDAFEYCLALNPEERREQVARALGVVRNQNGNFEFDHQLTVDTASIPPGSYHLPTVEDYARVRENELPLSWTATRRRYRGDTRIVLSSPFTWRRPDDGHPMPFQCVRR